ncbi:MAG: ClbS/DfsB family four-helix bundle protein [Pirellulaceae bacterium]|nr:ClbS/DfsB family four-helix bundle protein [Pirellulaceae bacterium]
MPKPASKTDLLAGNEDAFRSLSDLLAPLSKTQLDRNVRDVLAHLYEWQQMMFQWYQVGMAGGTLVMPAPGFTWQTTPKLNQQIWQSYQSFTLADVRKKLNRSHNKLQKLIEKHSNEELFTKRHYPWTGSTSLGAFLTSAGWSHYNWALKILRKFAKQC